MGKVIDTKQHGHLKSRSISGPEDTIGGTAEPRQKLIRGGGGGAPVHHHNLSFVICNCIFVILDWIFFSLCGSMWILFTWQAGAIMGGYAVSKSIALWTKTQGSVHLGGGG